MSLRATLQTTDPIQLAQELCELYSKSQLLKFVKLLDAFVADEQFSKELADELVDGLKIFGMRIVLDDSVPEGELRLWCGDGQGL